MQPNSVKPAPAYSIKRMQKTLLALLSLALPLITLNLARAEPSDLLQIDKVVWTDNVDRKLKNYTHAYIPPVKQGHISLWMQLRGSPELLQRMKDDADGQVHIRHVWKKYELNRLRTDLNQPLDIGRKEDLQKLSNEVSATGYFTWRVWSDKMNLPEGDWQVDLLWDTGDPVMCTSNSGEQSACSYALQVH